MVSRENIALIPALIRRVLTILAEKLESSKTSWAITGSTSLALQGLDIVPHDIDILTDEEGAYAIAELFREHIVSPVSFKKSPKYESHFGALRIEDVDVEIMGELRVFRGGRWLPVMTPRTRRIENVEVENHWVPVLSLTSLKESGYLDERLARSRNLSRG
jgi:hypothetical protein